MQMLGLEGRKWEIFESAVYTFADRGYENVSMREIAKINDIQAASIYYYFDSKDTLLETIYEFYSSNIVSGAPDRETLFQEIPNGKPHDVLFRLINNFSDELQPLMDCIYIIAISQMNHDQRAYELIYKNTFLHSENHMRAALEKMTDMGKIEPLDIDSFVKLYSSFLYTASSINRLPNPMGMDRWASSLRILFTLVKEKNVDN